jgi:general secretion pathway protein G
MRTMRRNTHTFLGARTAFTLIELLLVMVILAVLAAVVVPRIAGRGEQAKNAAAKTDIANIGLMLDSYEIDTGHYPSNEEGLQALIQPPSNIQGWKGPYIKTGAVPMDPWGRPYQYKYPGSHSANGYDLYSLGADGVEGGDDVDSWSQGQSSVK